MWIQEFLVFPAELVYNLGEDAPEIFPTPMPIFYQFIYDSLAVGNDFRLCFFVCFHMFYCFIFVLLHLSDGL